MALNAPRTIPFDFRVVEWDGWIWLFDDSERTYICSAQPMIWIAPLYPVEQDDDSGFEYPDPDYISASDEAFAKAGKVPVEFGADADSTEAWDDAREEANANYLL